MKIEAILDQWVNVTEYDRDQNSFNLLSSNYQFNRSGKLIEALLKWDASGLVPMLYAKASFESICKGVQIKLIDYMKNPDAFQDYLSMWQSFESSEVVAAEDAVIRKLVEMTNICPAIGDIDKAHELDMFRDAIEYIGEELTKCNIEAFSIERGTFIADKLQFHKDIHVFNTTTECMLKIENSEDGLYLCYINEFNSTGGYFTYIVKSDNNIITVNDRLMERFVGMHTRSRNNRHIEEKKWNLFPYNDMISAGENRDYKGYAKSLICEIRPHPIVELSPKSIYPVMLGAYLVQCRFCGQSVTNLIDSGEVRQVYIDSLMKNSIEAEQVTALVPVDIKSSLVCMTNTSLTFDFNSDNVCDNSLNIRYAWKENQDKKPYYEIGTFNDTNKILIDAFGSGFELDSSKVMVRKWPELTEGDSGSSDTVIAEFIGTRGAMELEYYRQCRKQLADHIIDNMVVAYDEAGGYIGVRQWYLDAVNQNVEQLRQMAVDWYIRLQDGEARNYAHGACWLPTGSAMNITVEEGESAHWFAGLDRDFKLNEVKTRYHNYPHGSPVTYCCPVNGMTANVWFLFQPNTAENISILANQPVPKILTGFAYTHRADEHRGNNLISSCDPVAFIENPFAYHAPSYYREKFKGGHDYRFMVALGFSKRGLNQLVRKRKQELESL